VQQQVNYWLQIVTKDLSKYSLETFKETLRAQHIKADEEESIKLYQRLASIQLPVTVG